MVSPQVTFAVRHAKLNKDALKMKRGPYSSHTSLNLLTFHPYTQLDLTFYFIKAAVPCRSRSSNGSCRSTLGELVTQPRTARLVDQSPLFTNNLRRIRA